MLFQIRPAPAAEEAGNLFASTSNAQLFRHGPHGLQQPRDTENSPPSAFSNITQPEGFGLQQSSDVKNPEPHAFSDASLSDSFDRQQFNNPCSDPSSNPDRRQEDPFSQENPLHSTMFDNAPSLAVPYELRPGPRGNDSVVFCTWVDQDRTGDYDPENGVDPGIKPPAEIAAGCKRTRDPNDSQDSSASTRPKVPRITTWQRGRLEGQRMPLTLKFHSEKGKSVLQTLGTALDNWPKSAFLPPGQDIDWEAWWHQDFTLTTELGTRIKKVSFEESGDDGDDLPLQDLTLGHPAARGCKPCFELKQRCPLLDEGSQYPCDTCVEDEVECELVLEPKVKRSCEVCSKSRNVCSYRDSDSDHGQPCKNCMHKGFKCIAGPASGRTRTGPALDAPRYNLPARVTNKAYVTCAPCRQAKKWCSFRGKADGKQKACNQCKKMDVHCHTEPLKQSKAPSSRIKKAVLVEKTDTYQATANVPEQFTIQTKFAHPMAFGCGDGQSCNWCESDYFGILGLGTVEVQVRSEAGAYTEIAGGHRAEGHLPSQMCQSCTMDRMRILACEAHNIQPIPGKDPGAFDHSLVEQHLMSAEFNAAAFAWCSVCLNAAFFTCCAQDSEDTIDSLSTENAGAGCGLVLCEACAVLLVSEKAGNLTELIGDLRVEEKEQALILRADAELLCSQGHLMRAMLGG